MRDFTVMQMSKGNREKGYFFGFLRDQLPPYPDALSATRPTGS